MTRKPGPEGNFYVGIAWGALFSFGFCWLPMAALIWWVAS